MFGRASGKSKLLKTHDDAGCVLLRCARGIRARAVTTFVRELCPSLPQSAPPPALFRAALRATDCAHRKARSPLMATTSAVAFGDVAPANFGP